MQRDSLAQRAWYQGYQGYRGVSTHRASGTKDSTCSTCRVLGCRETYWHRESGTKGTEGYQHRVSGTKDSTIWHNRLRFIAVFNCFYLFSRFKNLGGNQILSIEKADNYDFGWTDMDMSVLRIMFVLTNMDR